MKILKHLLTIAALFLLLAATTNAGKLIVTNDDGVPTPGSLMDMIGQATSGTGGDTIVFAPHITLITFQFGINLPHSGFPLVIDGEGRVTIKSTGFASLFEASGVAAAPGQPAVLRETHFLNLTFENARPAIAIRSNGRVKAENCIFKDNLGSAVSITQSEFIAHNCTFYNNTTEYNGGAINVMNNALLVATNCTFYNNEAPLLSTIEGGDGGEGEIDTSGKGGGGTGVIRRGYGGAIYIHEFANEPLGAYLYHNTFISNKARSGGGAIFIDSILENNVIYKGSAYSYNCIYMDNE